MTSSQSSSIGGWVWPAVGLGVLAVMMVLFLQRVGDRYDDYEAGYSWTAIGIGLLPAILAASLLIELGSRRARGESANGLTIASLVTMTLSVPATAGAATMLGVS